MSEPLSDGVVPVGPKPPVESKVKTASVAAAAAPILWTLFQQPDLKAAIVAAGVAVVSAASAFVTGWLTQHTPRAE